MAFPAEASVSGLEARTQWARSRWGGARGLPFCFYHHYFLDGTWATHLMFCLGYPILRYPTKLPNVSSIKFDSCYMLYKGANGVKAKFIGSHTS